MRRKITEAERRQFFAELDRSGESTWRVAQRLGLSPKTAYRWVAARREALPKFARVVPAPAPEVTHQRRGITIELGAARIVVENDFEPSLLRAVVAALREEET